MPDVQSSRSLRKLARTAGSTAAEFYRYILGYSALALFVGAVVILSIPELRAQALAVHSAAVASTAPAEIPESVVLEGAAAAATDAEAPGKVIAQARPLALEHVSHAQVEALEGYIGKKYKVSTAAVRSLVDTVWSVGGEKKLDPLLLLAVIAIESSFDPFAESGMGAQGLMQVMTRIHHEKFKPFGGTHAAWRPDANIEVGATILRDCIRQRGSVAGGLTCYVGSPGTVSAYGRKVLAERERLLAAVSTRGEPPAALAALGPDSDGTVAAVREGAKAVAADTAAAEAARATADHVASNEATASLTLREGDVVGM